MKKIELEDITPEMLDEAAAIVRHVVAMQSEPADPAIGQVVLNAIMKLQRPFRARGPRNGLRDMLGDGLRNGLDAGLYADLSSELDIGLHDELGDGLGDGLYAGLRRGLDIGLHDGIRDRLHDGQFEINSFYCGIFWSWWLARYLIAAAWGCKVDFQKLALLYAFCRFCPLVGIVKEKNDERFVVLPKPKNIKFVETGMTTGSIPLPIFELHADGESSAEYADIKLYHWHNVKIPERMGKTKSKNWSAKWLLDEPNAEVKRLLIQEIGYEKIMNELGAKCLDVWIDEGQGGRYELMKIKQKADIEPIVLCKMSCPSTNGDYAIRVPPNTKTAYDAITWIRHGIRPEQMICQH